MEVRPGYKQTEVGVIPEDWDVRPFAELLEFRNGVNADKTAYGQGIRFINVLEPITYSHIYGSEITGRVSLPDALVQSYSVHCGDVLFNRTSETQQEVALAATYLGSELVVFGGFVIRGRPTDDRLDPLYTGYAFRAPWIRSQIVPLGQGAVRANVGQQNLGQVLAPVPPLPEQRAIAEALGDVDELLRALDRLIAKKRDLKQATMQQLLTGQTRLPGFSGKWEAKRLGDLAEITAGGTPSRTNPDYWDGDIPWITTTQIEFGTIYEATQFITDEGLRNSATRLYPSGTLLMALYGQGKTRGKVGKLGIEASINQACAAISIRRAVSVDYLLHHLTSRYDEIRDMSNSGSQENLNSNIVRNIVVLVPPESEQTAIAEVLSDMVAEIAALEQRQEKTRALKQGMMQELLTGRTRLI